MYLTILIPVLNEEKTIGICIKKAQEFIKKNKIEAEILIADNGSTDKSVEIAKKMNVNIIEVPEKGYGNALIAGTKAAKGKYVIMGDADDSYNFLELEEFLKMLEKGYDLVIGNRYKGKIEKGSIKFLKRYIGTPILSMLVRKKYKVNIHDINCGLRGYDREKILNTNCKSKGMEYATEMIINAKKNDVKIIEIPINFYKDKRGKKSHLRTIKDGMRHLKLILEQ